MAAMRQPSEIRADIISVAKRYAESEAMEPHAHYDDELEYCEDMLDEFAAELTKANQELHEKEVDRALGWPERWASTATSRARKTEDDDRFDVGLFEKRG